MRTNNAIEMLRSLNGILDGILQEAEVNPDLTPPVYTDTETNEIPSPDTVRGIVVDFVTTQGTFEMRFQKITEDEYKDIMKDQPKPVGH